MQYHQKRFNGSISQIALCVPIKEREREPHRFGASRKVERLKKLLSFTLEFGAFFVILYLFLTEL